MAIIRCKDIERGTEYFYTRVTGAHCITQNRQLAHDFAWVAEAVREAEKLQKSPYFYGIELTVDDRDMKSGDIARTEFSEEFEPDVRGEPVD